LGLSATPSEPAARPRKRRLLRWLLGLMLGLGALLLLGYFAITPYLPPPALTAGTEDDEVVSLSFSPDGTLVSAQANGRTLCGTVMVWDTASREKRLFCEEYPYSVHGAAFSPNGRYLAVAACRPLHMSGVPGNCTMVFSPEDPTVELYDSRGGRLLASLR